MAAVEAQRMLGAEPWPEPAPVKVRMGLHTGRAIERDGDYFGPVVIRAARLMGLVGGGRIVCSKTTAELVGALLPEDVHLVSVGSVRLRGLSAPEASVCRDGTGAPGVGSGPRQMGALRGDDCLEAGLRWSVGLAKSTRSRRWLSASDSSR